MLKAYASYFAAYLMDNLNKSVRANIERIILFGSVAKEEATKDSDVDIFIELKKQNKQTEKSIINIINEFYKSKDAMLFKVRGVDNKINIKLGKLKEWEELYTSVASTGIILYGPYEAKELPSGVKHSIIIFWDEIKKNRGAFLNKIYGFNVNEKHYNGLLESMNGKKIGKSSIMMPIEHKNEIFKLLEKYKVKAKIIEVFI